MNMFCQKNVLQFFMIGFLGVACSPLSMGCPVTEEFRRFVDHLESYRAGQAKYKPLDWVAKSFLHNHDASNSKHANAEDRISVLRFQCHAFMEEEASYEKLLKNAEKSLLQDTEEKTRGHYLILITMAWGMKKILTNPFFVTTYETFINHMTQTLKTGDLEKDPLLQCLAPETLHKLHNIKESYGNNTETIFPKKFFPLVMRYIFSSPQLDRKASFEAALAFGDAAIPLTMPAKDHPEGPPVVFQKEPTGQANIWHVKRSDEETKGLLVDLQAPFFRHLSTLYKEFFKDHAFEGLPFVVEEKNAWHFYGKGMGENSFVLTKEAISKEALLSEDKKTVLSCQAKLLEAYINHRHPKEKAVDFWTFAQERNNRIARCLQGLPDMPYEDVIIGMPPSPKDFEKDPPEQFIKAYEEWAAKCYAQDPQDDDKEKIPHQCTWTLLKHDKIYHHESHIQAKRFYSTPEGEVTFPPNSFVIPHKKTQESLEKDTRYFLFEEGVFKETLTINGYYEIPALPPIEGMEESLIYNVFYRVGDPQEAQRAWKESVNETQEQKMPEEGQLYDVIEKEFPENPYFYSSGEKLYLTHYVQVHCQKSGLGLSNVQRFHYLRQTPHEVSLKPGFQHSDPSGFLSRGLYKKEGDHWIKIDGHFKPLDQGPMKLHHPTETNFIQTLLLHPDALGEETLNEIKMFKDFSRVEGLNFSGTAFTETLQKPLKDLLMKGSNHLKSLNLLKPTNTLSYEPLISTLLAMKALRTLNIQGGLLSEASLNKLKNKLGNGLTPQPQPPKVDPPVPAPAPEPPKKKEPKVVRVYKKEENNPLTFVKRVNGRDILFKKVFKSIYHVYSNGVEKNMGSSNKEIPICEVGPEKKQSGGGTYNPNFKHLPRAWH